MGIDISSRSTGWSVIEGDKLIKYGKINPSGKMTTAQKMYLFSVELRKVIDEHQPDEIAIEDVVQVRGVSVLKLLARFNGVAIIESYRHLQRDPTLFIPSEWKKLVEGCTGSSKKAQVQLSICIKYGLLSQEKIDSYSKRIEEAKKEFGDDCESSRQEIKLLRKALKKCKRKDSGNIEKIHELENQIEELTKSQVKNKKVDKKKFSEVFDKISIDIYTETAINEDIADSVGVAIAFQKVGSQE